MTTRTKKSRLALARLAFGIGACALLFAATADAQWRKGSARDAAERYRNKFEATLRNRVKDPLHKRVASLRKRIDALQEGPYGNRVGGFLKEVNERRANWAAKRAKWGNQFQTAKKRVSTQLSKGSLYAQKVLHDIKNTGLGLTTARQEGPRHGVASSSQDRNIFARAITATRKRSKRLKAKTTAKKHTSLAVLDRHIRSAFRAPGSTSPLEAGKIAFAAIKRRVSALKDKHGPSSPSSRAAEAALRERRGDELRQLKMALEGPALAHVMAGNDIRLLAKTSM